MFSLVFSSEFYRTCQIKSEICFFWGVGVTWGYLVSLVVKSQNYQTWTNKIPKWSSWPRDYEKLVFELTWPQIGDIWGHLGLWGHNPNILKHSCLINEIEALELLFNTNWFLTSSPERKSGSFGVKIRKFQKIDANYERIS